MLGLFKRIFGTNPELEKLRLAQNEKDRLAEEARLKEAKKISAAKAEIRKEQAENRLRNKQKREERKLQKIEEEKQERLRISKEKKRLAAMSLEKILKAAKETPQRKSSKPQPNTDDIIMETSRMIQELTENINSMNASNNHRNTYHNNSNHSRALNEHRAMIEQGKMEKEIRRRTESAFKHQVAAQYFAEGKTEEGVVTMLLGAKGGNIYAALNRKK